MSLHSETQHPDPCYGTVKTLKVIYRVNGQPAHFTGTDPELCDLLEQE